MQVSDGPSVPAAGPAPRDDPRSGGDAPDGQLRARSGHRFRSALERKSEGGVPGSEQAASAAALTGWFRPESGPTLVARLTSVAAASPVRAVDRVLIGSGPDGAQARIHIAAGALAGTEIQVKAGAAAHAVEVRLLTHAASSRQTLSLVMDEIRSRLQSKGIALSTKPPAARSLPGAEVRVDGGGASARSGVDVAGSSR